MVNSVFSYFELITVKNPSVAECELGEPKRFVMLFAMTLYFTGDLSAATAVVVMVEIPRLCVIICSGYVQTFKFVCAVFGFVSWLS